MTQEHLVEVVRQVCLDAALRAYEDAGVRGLCAEGRWEAAVSAIQSLTHHELCEGLPVGPRQPGEENATPTEREAWLSGPVAGVPTALGPAAHALLDAVAEAERAVVGLSPAALQARPGGVASIEFHLRHSAGAIDRLLTYARGQTLTTLQHEALVAEQEPRAGAKGDDLLAELRAAVDDALTVYRGCAESSLEEPRPVGRAGLPSTVRGLLYHAAEHTRRHSGQIVTTAAVLRGLPSNPDD